ncbi:MAG: hypothetical protein Q4F41_12455 [Eubacteriales bacterium]|nr:hypothetical protein [Eubacteriales bacterium]
MWKKLMGYELKRLMWNWYYLGFLLVLLAYGWQVFRGVVIFGVNHTAPFSLVSFGAYLLWMLPVVLAVLGVFAGKMVSKKERKVQALILACPVRKEVYWRLRIGAAVIAAGVLYAAAILEILVIYLWFFWI